MKTANFDPGARWSYSNTNYTLAGLIVERKNKAGQRLAAFAYENIFHPLAMTSTRFVEKHGEIVANRAYGYRGKKDFDQPPFEVRMPNYDLTGPTNLVTTVEDLVRWEANFSSKIVGDDDIFAKMLMPYSINAELGYGFGLYIGKDKIGGLIVEHDGQDAGEGARRSAAVQRVDAARCNQRSGPQDRCYFSEPERATNPTVVAAADARATVEGAGRICRSLLQRRDKDCLRCQTRKWKTLGRP
jgi:CubicO group peptidase (beta-lactamase class C family)